jgi:EAL domain-containing protein (putative c-di-GMP-specific phosphodiesterase class I)
LTIVFVGLLSLSRLSSLPLDKLKVDQSFVRRIERDQVSRAVTEAILALGRSLKLDVVGEVIESEHVLHYLQEHGCNLAQGTGLASRCQRPNLPNGHGNNEAEIQQLLARCETGQPDFLQLAAPTIVRYQSDYPSLLIN